MFRLATLFLLCLLSVYSLSAHELVEIKKIDPCIGVRENACGCSPRRKAYLVCQVAKQLRRVQKELERDCVTLVVLEAYRPSSYAGFFGTPYSFEPVDECNPIVNGHYRGTAVDVTIAYQNGQPLEMPPFLDTHELEMLGTDKYHFSCEAYHNLEKLRMAMEKHRFVQSPFEWWHFDYKDWFQYPVLDIPFEELEEQF